MKFRKYSGEIKDLFLTSSIISILCLAFSLYFFAKSGEFAVILLLFAAPTAYLVISSVTTMLRLVHLDNASISDMIILSDEKVELQYKKGGLEVILYADIVRIEKIRSKFNRPQISIISVDGRKIWWYSTGKAAENYMLSRHPELESVMSEKISY